MCRLRVRLPVVSNLRSGWVFSQPCLLCFKTHLLLQLPPPYLNNSYSSGAKHATTNYHPENVQRTLPQPLLVKVSWITTILITWWNGPSRDVPTLSRRKLMGILCIRTIDHLMIHIGSVVMVHMVSMVFFWGGGCPLVPLSIGIDGTVQ